MEKPKMEMRHQISGLTVIRESIQDSRMLLLVPELKIIRTGSNLKPPILQISILSSSPGKQVNANHFTHLLLHPPKKIFFLDFSFTWKKTGGLSSRTNYYQSVHDFKEVSRATVSPTQMLHINRCQVLLYPPQKKYIYTMCTCRNWNTIGTVFSF